ncbi:hypothetical protein D3261_10465 [Halococcus sp. IIIV-5B]|nr:hypothetical protein D3261_10465 [Halococcus sp. IIIV-5B]
MKKYDKGDLVLAFASKLNNRANYFFEHNGIPIPDFGYLPYLVKIVQDGFGFRDERIDDPSEREKVVEELRDGYAVVIKRVEEIRSGMVVCLKEGDVSPNPRNWIEDYKQADTEYRLCFDRCAKSMIIAEKENLGDFDYIDRNFRDFGFIDGDNADTLTGYAKKYYKIMIPLSFVASLDRKIGDPYTTHLPKNISVFQLQEFIDTLHLLVKEIANDGAEIDPYLFAIEEEIVDECGKEIFKEQWGEIKRNIVVSEDSVDAHPFLFQTEVTEERMMRGGRTPRKLSRSVILFPKQYDRLLLFQIFPLLQNGDEPAGGRILESINSDIGPMFERGIYEYLDEKGIEAYHSATLTKNEPTEIDVIYVHNNTLWFVEIKWTLPPLRMNSVEGIEKLDDKFDNKIFKTHSGELQDESGKPFPEKVDKWLSLPTGSSFSSQEGTDSSEQSENTVKDEWDDMDVQKLVVSNLAPSYVEKESVRFLTDLEFYQMIEHGEDPFYRIDSEPSD